MSNSSNASSGVLTLFYIDIDDFKTVNDTYGHALGDELLSMFCSHVLKCLRYGHKVLAGGRRINFSRLAGDEFALVIRGIDNPEAAERVARRIVDQLAAPFVLPSAEVQVQVNIGIPQSKVPTGRGESLLKKADKAMYAAKKRGKNQYQFFDAKLAESIGERQRIVVSLTNVPRDDALDLVFMPVYECQSLKVVGAEALLRCSSGEFRGVSPGQFVQVAEQQGLIREIDLIVLENAFAKIRAIANEEDTAACKRTATS